MGTLGLLILITLILLLLVITYFLDNIYKSTLRTEMIVHSVLVTLLDRQTETQDNNVNVLIGGMVQGRQQQEEDPDDWWKNKKDDNESEED